MPTQAQRKEVEEARLKDMKIKNYLFQLIDKTIMETILDKNTTKSIWDSMRQKYLGSTRVKRAQLQALRKEFEILQMKEGEKVDEYFARVLTIANKMKAHEEIMGQNVIVKKILRSMTPRFNYVVCSIEESNNVDTMTIDELQSSLLVHEQRMNCHNGNARDEQALKFHMEKGMKEEAEVEVLFEAAREAEEVGRRVQTMLSSMKKKRCSSCRMMKSTTRNEKMCGFSTRVAAITCAGIGSGSLTLMRLSDTQ
ncbi:hypothetical protein CK203_035133 [Vitis vinifera]|uniref:Retrovirus-related Pol polyprotein from transposon TNT 1-94 n=1 Tax=Vitis vinifera TaxID=29760 RepID=A0A438I9J9_VITVI|nr:hypothetical protein CK203_035133 [Vitis vinifera]